MRIRDKAAAILLIRMKIRNERMLVFTFGAVTRLTESQGATVVDVSALSREFGAFMKAVFIYQTTTGFARKRTESSPLFSLLKQEPVFTGP